MALFSGDHYHIPHNKKECIFQTTWKNEMDCKYGKKTKQHQICRLTQYFYN